MGNLIKGLKVAAFYVAEIIVAGSVVIELLQKSIVANSGKKRRLPRVKSRPLDAATEN